jgi:hypothetical protein
MRILRSIGALLLASALVVAKDAPDISISKFEGRPKDLFFFDDTEVVLAIDEDRSLVYRSTDAGADWDRIGDIKEGLARSIHQHPRDNAVAVVLGRGSRHWITYDQGKSWKGFDTPGPASHREPGIVFHWSDSKRILFNLREEFEEINGIGSVSCCPACIPVELVFFMRQYS